MRIIQSISMVFCIALLVACGDSGGGSGSKSKSKASPGVFGLTVDTVTIDGQAAWPGAALLEVQVDGSPVAVDHEGNWTALVDLQSLEEVVVDVEVYADSQLVSNTEVRVTR
ncbi:MAG: hypothetical protein HRU15_10555 [Planctomycetes bacterium]|nr:hypothetical protein [Planctomycetota bacterium]